MKKCEWREQFSFSVAPELTELEVRVIEKGGIFYGDSEMGEGSINLLENGNVKCIIGNK